MSSWIGHQILFMMHVVDDSKCFENLVGLNFKPFSFRKAPLVEWLNQSRASNVPSFASKCVHIHGSRELEQCHDIHDCLTNSGYQVQLPSPIPHIRISLMSIISICSTQQTMLTGANLQPCFWPMILTAM